MDMMEIRRRVMLSMASGAKVIKGTVTLTENQRTIELSCTFEPSIVFINIQEVSTEQADYNTIFGLFSLWITENKIPTTGHKKMVLQADCTYESPPRTATNYIVHSYADGIITLPSISAARIWAVGTYDYIIVE